MNLGHVISLLCVVLNTWILTRTFYFHKNVRINPCKQVFDTFYFGENSMLLFQWYFKYLVKNKIDRRIQIQKIPVFKKFLVHPTIKTVYVCRLLLKSPSFTLFCIFFWTIRPTKVNIEALLTEPENTWSLFYKIVSYKKTCKGKCDKIVWATIMTRLNYYYVAALLWLVKLMKNLELLDDTHFLEKWIKKYRLGHIRYIAI